MKLLFVHQYLGAMGGAEADILRSAQALNRQGHSASLLFAQPTGRNEQDWRRAFTDCIPLPGATAPQGAAEAARSFQPDAVYFHSLPGYRELESLLSCRAPIVRKLHDHEMYCMRGCKYNYFTRRVCVRPASWRCLFPCLAFARRRADGSPWPPAWQSYRAKRREIQLNQRCDCVVVYSQYQKEELIRNGFDPSRIEIHPPVQVWDGEAAVSSFSQRNRVLFVGQLLRGKGVDLLLRALAKIRVPFECDILGDGNHRGRCERLCARLGLGERVRFRGFVAPHAMASFYREAGLLAFPSVWPEPFGMVGREAMHHGLPVVAFDVGAVREWLQDGVNGFLVPAKDIGQFSARLEDLLKDKELARRMGQRGRREVQALCAAERDGDRLERTFLRVIRQAGIGTRTFNTASSLPIPNFL
jgi:glycosyltransferase involved in cell wall biosynthesis